MDKRETLIQRALTMGCTVRDADAPIVRIDGVFNTITLSVYVTVETLEFYVPWQGHRFKRLTHHDTWCRYPWYLTIVQMVDL